MSDNAEKEIGPGFVPPPALGKIQKLFDSFTYDELRSHARSAALHLEKIKLIRSLQKSIELIHRGIGSILRARFPEVLQKLPENIEDPSHLENICADVDSAISNQKMDPEFIKAYIPFMLKLMHFSSKERMDFSSLEMRAFDGLYQGGHESEVLRRVINSLSQKIEYDPKENIFSLNPSSRLSVSCVTNMGFRLIRKEMPQANVALLYTEDRHGRRSELEDGIRPVIPAFALAEIILESLKENSNKLITVIENSYYSGASAGNVGGGYRILYPNSDRRFVIGLLDNGRIYSDSLLRDKNDRIILINENVTKYPTLNFSIPFCHENNPDDDDRLFAWHIAQSI